ncbi:MAG: arylformamidase [Clostridiales bacterium]|nr:arylformamidase [Clostridiales bacterium]
MGVKFMAYQIIDITRPIAEGMVVWPGDPDVAIDELSSLARGDNNNVSAIYMSMHTGTHVDAPLHFIAGGKDTAEVDLNRFMGRAKVFDIGMHKVINADVLDGLCIGSNDIVLLKTMNGRLWDMPTFEPDFVYISEDAAWWLIRKGVKAVGIDYLSVEGFHHEGAPVHHILLSHEVGIIEGLDLRAVESGVYYLICLPLKIVKGNGSPVRAVLLCDTEEQERNI